MEVTLVSKQLLNERVLNVIMHIITYTTYQQPQAATATIEILETLLPFA